MASSHAKPLSISDTTPPQSSTAESAHAQRNRCCIPYANSSSNTPSMLPMKCDVSSTASGSTVSTSRRRASLTGMAFENNRTTPPVKVQPARTVGPTAPVQILIFSTVCANHCRADNASTAPVRNGLAAGGKEIRTVGPAVKEKPFRRAIWLNSREPTGRPASLMKPAHRGLKIYAALTWDRGFELLHRAQRHTNPIDPRPRLWGAQGDMLIN